MGITMVNHGELFLRISWDTNPTAAPASTRTGITEISDHGGLHFLPVKCDFPVLYVQSPEGSWLIRKKLESMNQPSCLRWGTRKSSKPLEICGDKASPTWRGWKYVVTGYWIIDQQGHSDVKARLLRLFRCQKRLPEGRSEQYGALVYVKMP